MNITVHNIYYGVIVMFYLVRTKMIVPVPPSELRPEMDINDIILGILRSTYEDSVHSEFGYIVAVLGVEIEGLGYITPENPSVFFKVMVEMLVFRPEVGEVIEGPVVSAIETGVYVNIGFTDAFISINALGHEHFRFDIRKGELRGTKTNTVIKPGDWIRGKLFPTTSTLVAGSATSLPKVRFNIRTPLRLEKMHGELRIRMSSRDVGLGLLREIYRRKVEETGIATS